MEYSTHNQAGSGVASASEDPKSTPFLQQWYSPNLENLGAGTREVLEQYSKIPSNEVVSHVHAIRDKGWSIHPYPCIGQWRFLDLSIGLHKLYPEILSRMRTGNQIFLDLGCAFGQDIRRLVFDGVDGSKCNGWDLHQDLLDLGYDLFRDSGTLRSKFNAVDILQDGASLPQELMSATDIIHAAEFFHLFSWDEQKKIARKVTELMNPTTNSLVVGRQIGHEPPGEVPRGFSGGSRFRHNVNTWRRMWAQVGEEMGVQFDFDDKATAFEVLMPDRTWLPEDKGGMAMEFAVRRL